MSAVLRDYANPIHRRPDPLSFWRGALIAGVIGLLAWDLLLLWFIAL